MLKNWIIALLALFLLDSSACWSNRNVLDKKMNTCSMCDNIGLLINDDRLKPFLHLEDNIEKSVRIKANEILSGECSLYMGDVQVEISDSFSKEQRYLEIVKYEIQDSKVVIEIECEFEGVLVVATLSKGKECIIESFSLVER